MTGEGLSRVKLAACIAILVACAVVSVSAIGRVWRFGEPRPPKWVMKQEVEKIDEQSLEVISLPLEKWKALGCRGERFKNPRTGQYTMVSVMLCASCGQKIPILIPPSDLTGPEYDALLRGYICPRCKRHAFEY